MRLNQLSCSSTFALKKKKKKKKRHGDEMPMSTFCPARNNKTWPVQRGGSALQVINVHFLSNTRRFSFLLAAFSFFSACEYGIAVTNIGFHYTAAADFKGAYWYLGTPSSVAAVRNHVKTHWDACASFRLICIRRRARCVSHNASGKTFLLGNKHRFRKNDCQGFSCACA